MICQPESTAITTATAKWTRPIMCDMASESQRNHGGTPAGYNTWRANFGSPGSGSALSLSSNGVPEPSTILLAALLVLGLWPGQSTCAVTE